MPLSWLHDPRTVAKFQHFCGKRRITVDEPKTNGSREPEQLNGSREPEQLNGSKKSKRNGSVNGSTGNGQSNGDVRARRDLRNGCLHHVNGSNGDGVNGGHIRGNGSAPAGAAAGTLTVQQQLPDTQTEETKVVHKYWLLRMIFFLTGTVGDELFFVLFLPAMFWNFDLFVGRRVVLLWFVALYSGTALKDTIQWERPSNKVVIREANDEHCFEYGMPSTHTLSGAIITMGLVYVTYLRYNVPLLPMLLVAVPLICLMGLSRMYSGHHTLLDVLAALVLGVAVTASATVFLEPMDALYMHPTVGPLAVVVTAVLAIIAYPHASPIRASSKDMPTIVSVFCGFYFGLWMSVGEFNPRDNRHLEPYLLPSPDKAEIVDGFARYATCVALLLVVREILKSLSLGFFSMFADEAKGPAKDQLPIVIAYRLVTYTGTCFSCIVLGPLIFRWLGIPTQEL